jgi:hypothetical protein
MINNWGATGHGVRVLRKYPYNLIRIIPAEEK